MQTREELRAKAREIGFQINEIDREEFRNKILPTTLQFVGTCFVYRRNCYSCPSKPSDYWDCFRKLLKVVVVDGLSFYLVYEEAFIDSLGHSVLQVTKTFSVGHEDVFGAGWTICTDRAYADNKRRVLSEMKSLKWATAAAKRKD